MICCASKGQHRITFKDFRGSLKFCDIVFFFKSMFVIYLSDQHLSQRKKNCLTHLTFVNRFKTDRTKPITDKTSLNFSYSSLYLNLKKINSYIVKKIEIRTLLYQFCYWNFRLKIFE